MVLGYRMQCRRWSPFPGTDAGLPSSDLYLTAGTRDSWTLDLKKLWNIFLLLTSPLRQIFFSLPHHLAKNFLL